MKEVAKAGIFHKGKYLMGVRQDSGKWTEPGGHLHRGEDPLRGVAREVKEETGLDLPLSNFKSLGAKEVAKPDGEKILVHAYKVNLKDEEATTPKGDPDHEVFGWDWIPVKDNKLPPIVNKSLHVPASKNVLHFFLGFEKSAFLRKIVKFRPTDQVKAFVLEIPGQTAQTLSQQEVAINKKRERK